MAIDKPGFYTARATSHSWGESSTGKEQLEIQFSTPEGNIRAFLFFTEASVDKSLEALENCGWDGVSLRTLDGLGSIECSLNVGEETYEGKTRVRVNWINKLGSGKPLPDSGLSALEKRLASKMADRKAKRGEPAEDFTDPFA